MRILTDWRLFGSRLRASVLHMISRARILGLAQTAGSLTFLSLLAFVPVVAVSLVVLTALPGLADWRAALQTFMAANLFLPAFSETVVGYVQTFASQAERLSVASTALFFATAFTTLFTIERTLNAIWEVRGRRAWLTRVTLYWVMLTLGPLLLGASLALDSYLWSISLTISRPVRAGPAVVGAGPADPADLRGPGAVVSADAGHPCAVAHAVFGAVVASIRPATVQQACYYVAKFPTYTVVYAPSPRCRCFCCGCSRCG